jgi:hypothetical protein
MRPKRSRGFWGEQTAGPLAGELISLVAGQARPTLVEAGLSKLPNPQRQNQSLLSAKSRGLVVGYGSLSRAAENRNWYGICDPYNMRRYTHYH